MTKTHINWDKFHEACVNTAQLVNRVLSPVHTIVAISRGGLVPARIMAEHIKSTLCNYGYKVIRRRHPR